jgi:AbrB family looped-hinge helix DNA binding protein
MREIVKVTRRGRITIPVHFRRRHGIEEGGQVILEDRGDAILIRPLPQLEDMGGFLAKATTVERLLKTLRESRQDHG